MSPLLGTEILTDKFLVPELRMKDGARQMKLDFENHTKSCF